ncbi:TPA: DUF6236 family protein [Legionella bozemanae]
MERGIIIGPEVELDVDNNSIRLISSQPNPYLLRHAVLYWDKIDFPQCFIHCDSPDINFLEKEGVAQQTFIPVRDNDEIASLYLQAQLDAFKLLTEKEPGKWTIGQYAKKFINSSMDCFSDKQLVEIEINNVLPVPHVNTSLDDLLELKQKRKDEFHFLRDAIDQLYNDALKWDSLPRGKNASINRLEEAINDIRKVVNSSWLKNASTLKLEFNLTDIFGGFLVGCEAAEKLGMIELSAMFGIVGSLIFTLKSEKEFGIAYSSDKAKNFAALYYVEKEFPGTI